MTLRHPALAWLCAAAILVICWLPASQTPVRQQDIPLANADKLIHFVMFAAYAVLGRWTGLLGGRLGKLALFGVGLAVLSELGQAVPVLQRTANLSDVVADVLGLFAGLAISGPFRIREPSSALASPAESAS